MMDGTIIRLIIFAILLTSLQGSVLCLQSLGVIKLWDARPVFRLQED